MFGAYVDEIIRYMQYIYSTEHDHAKSYISLLLPTELHMQHMYSALKNERYKKRCEAQNE